MSCFNWGLFRDAPIAAKYACSKCGGVTNSPIEDSFGHLFGKKCLEVLIRSDS